MVGNISKKYKEQKFLPRIISSLILAPVVLFFIYIDGYAFYGLILLCSLVMLLEWYNIVRNSKDSKKAKLVWYLAGIVYTILPCFSFIYLRGLTDSGFQATIWLILVVWASDIGGYIFGVAFGGKKLIPKISPAKTWSGLFGCITFSIIVSFIFIYVTGEMKDIWILIGGIVALVSQGGDILESAIKRHFKIKDSGVIIPGHGGILDRTDGFVTSAPFVALLYYFNLMV